MTLAQHTIAVVGATGVVGREILAILADRGIPARNIRCLASARSAGTAIPYRDSQLTVAEATPASFAGCTLALFAASSAVARELAPHAIEAGAIVIDNSSAFRLKPGVPLVVPELLSEPLPKRPAVIANPNCSTIILLAALNPLRRFGLRAINVATYQAVSGAGQAGLDALRAEIEGKPAAGSPFTEPCFLNVFSHNSAVDAATGLNGEEQKIIDESRKILGQPGLAVTPACVRVPVYRAHSQAITVRLGEWITEAELRASYEGVAGIGVIDDRAANRFPTPLKAANKDEVLVGRFRPDPARPLDEQGRTDSWCLFACGDQLRKGAALNAVQIAERL